MWFESLLVLILFKYSKRLNISRIRVVFLTFKNSSRLCVTFHSTFLCWQNCFVLTEMWAFKVQHYFQEKNIELSSIFPIHLRTSVFPHMINNSRLSLLIVIVKIYFAVFAFRNFPIMNCHRSTRDYCFYPAPVIYCFCVFWLLSTPTNSYILIYKEKL